MNTEPAIDISKKEKLDRIFKGIRELKTEAYNSDHEASRLSEILEITHKQRNYYKQVLSIISNGEDPKNPGSLASAVLLRKMAQEAISSIDYTIQ